MTADVDDFDPRYDVDITGLPWWRVLQRLHQHTRAVGLGHLRDRALSDHEAMEIIGQRRIMHEQRPSSESFRFDYVAGRPLKVTFVEREDRAWLHRADLYDCNASVSAHRVVEALRQEGEPPS